MDARAGKSGMFKDMSNFLRMCDIFAVSSGRELCHNLVIPGNIWQLDFNGKDSRPTGLSRDFKMVVRQPITLCTVNSITHCSCFLYRPIVKDKETHRAGFPGEKVPVPKFKA